MNKNKVLECMEKLVEVGKINKYTPEEFRSGILGVLIIIDNKIKENENGK